MMKKKFCNSQICLCLISKAGITGFMLKGEGTRYSHFFAQKLNYFSLKETQFMQNVWFEKISLFYAENSKFLFFLFIDISQG